MICSICGCEMKNNGDWFACPTCGSVHFGPDPEENVPVAKPPVIKEEPPVKTAEKPIEKYEPLAEPIKPIVEKPKPLIEKAPEPVKKQESFTKDFLFHIEDLEEPRVKENAFTVDKKPFNDDFSTPISIIDDTEPEEPLKKEEIKVSADPPKKTIIKEPQELPKQKEIEIPEELPIQEKIEEPEEIEETEKPKAKKKKVLLKDIVDFMLPIVAAVVIAFVLKTFIIANAKVPTGSMIATINVDDRIIASRLAYKTEDPNRYDIVLFYYPDNENDIFVKRVLALPGETLEVIDGIVYVTTSIGKTIQTEQSFVNPAETPSGNYGPYYVPEKGEVITLENGYCFAENGMLVGREEFLDKYCEKDEYGDYVIAENLYFMMGDNRNQSLDSRGWDFPYVKESKIIGKVIFKYYPKFEKIQ